MLLLLPVQYAAARTGQLNRPSPPIRDGTFCRPTCATLRLRPGPLSATAERWATGPGMASTAGFRQDSGIRRPHRVYSRPPRSRMAKIKSACRRGPARSPEASPSAPTPSASGKETRPSPVSFCPVVLTQFRAIRSALGRPVGGERMADWLPGDGGDGPRLPPDRGQTATLTSRHVGGDRLADRLLGDALAATREANLGIVSNERMSRWISLRGTPGYG